MRGRSRRIAGLPFGPSLSVVPGRALLVAGAALLIFAAVAEPAAAQTTSDADGPLATVRALFDAMAAKDTAALRAVFHPEARLMSAGFREGEPELRSLPIDDFIRSIGSAEAALLEELRDPEVRVDGPLATVWTGYDFYADGELSHCGVDAFQLFRSADGWTITQITDTRRREGCRAP